MSSLLPLLTPSRASKTLILTLISLPILHATARNQHAQQPIFGPFPTTTTTISTTAPQQSSVQGFIQKEQTTEYTYSVGFHLASSYGAAAVIVSDPNNKDNILHTHTFTTPGTPKYKSTMSRFSLHSSEHLAPPYDSMESYFDDIPRVLARRARKKSGLPASEDVGSLSTVITPLLDQIQSSLNISVTDAVITSAHLHALYQDDLYDIAQYAGVQYMEPTSLFKPILWELGAACAGYGLNLCDNYRHKEACYDEIRQFRKLNVLEVHYSSTALTSTLARMLTPTSAYDPDSRRVEDFTLGSNALMDGRYKGHGGEETYWRDVERAIIKRMVEYPTMGRPDLVILTGDQVHGNEKFREVLEHALGEVMNELPGIMDGEPMVIAAKGAAELRRRGAEAPREN